LSTARSKIRSVESGGRGEEVMGVWEGSGVLGGVSVNRRRGAGRLGEAGDAGLETGAGTRTGERAGEGAKLETRVGTMSWERSGDINDGGGVGESGGGVDESEGREG